MFSNDEHFVHLDFWNGNRNPPLIPAGIYQKIFLFMRCCFYFHKNAEIWKIHLYFILWNKTCFFRFCEMTNSTKCGRDWNQSLWSSFWEFSWFWKSHFRAIKYVDFERCKIFKIQLFFKKKYILNEFWKHRAGCVLWSRKIKNNFWNFQFSWKI